MSETIQRDRWVDPKITVFGAVSQLTMTGLAGKSLGVPNDGYFYMGTQSLTPSH